MHVTEIVKLSVVSHIILDAGTMSVVEGMTEGIIAVTDLGGILIELNHILHDSVSVVHPGMFEGILSIFNSIKKTKVGSEFVKKGSIRVLPCQQIPWVWMEDVWFKPVKSGAGKKKMA